MTTFNADDAFMIPIEPYMIFSTDRLPGNGPLPPGVKKYNAIAERDMVLRNGLKKDEYIFRYAWAEIEPIHPNYDKADERSVGNNLESRIRDSFWVKICVKKSTSTELIAPGNFIVRPCPPFCSLP